MTFTLGFVAFLIIIWNLIRGGIGTRWGLVLFALAAAVLAGAITPWAERVWNLLTTLVGLAHNVQDGVSHAALGGGMIATMAGLPWS